MSLTRTFAIAAQNAASGTGLTTGTFDSSAGQFLVVFTKHEGAPTTISVTDNKGSGTLTPLTKIDHSNGDLSVQLHYGPIGTPGSGHTVTMTLAAARAFRDCKVWVLNADGTVAFDVEATGGQGNGTAATTSSYTTSGAAISIMGASEDTTAATYTAGSGWTEDSDENENFGGSRSDASAGTFTANCTVSTTVDWVCVAAAFKEVSSATLEQEGFRFGEDDANEAGHTWTDAQDTSITAAAGTKLLRVLVDATDDPAAIAYTLYSQKNGSGGYTAVPVGSTVPEVYGTVTFGAIGTGANGSTSVAPSYPAGIAAGQYLVCVVTSGATNSETPTTPSGWTLLATGASTDGTYGVDTGPRRVTVFGKEATGSESGTLTVSITNGGTCRGSIMSFTKSGSGSWLVEAQGANDSTSGTGFSATGASMNWNTGDVAIVAVGQRVDTVTQSSQSLTASGVTFGTRTNRASTAVTTGNDHRHVVDTFAAITSTSDVDAAPTWAFTGSAACSGGVVFVRLREYTAAVSNECYVSTSSNIASGGEATTARLTAPSGKSTSDFVTGRRWDDENGTDTIDITSDDYTEVEWAIALAGSLSDGDYFDFRVYQGASPLDTYTVTPRWTVGSSGFTASASITFGAMTSAGTATVRVDAQAAITLGALTSSGAIAVDVSASANITLGAMTLSAAAAVLVQAQASINLGAMTLASVASVGDGAMASANITFDAMTLSSTATVRVDASASITLGALTLLSSAAVNIEAQASITFGPLVLSAAADNGDVGPAPGTDGYQSIEWRRRGRR